MIIFNMAPTGNQGSVRSEATKPTGTEAGSEGRMRSGTNQPKAESTDSAVSSTAQGWHART